MNNAEINFDSVCSNCGHIIFDEINFVEDEAFNLLANNTHNYAVSYVIKPNKCPHCGCDFKLISMPYKLPYTYNNLELKKKVMTEHPEEYSRTCKGCWYNDGTFHYLCTVCTRMSFDGEEDYYELEQEESK